MAIALFTNENFDQQEPRATVWLWMVITLVPSFDQWLRQRLRLPMHGWIVPPPFDDKRLRPDLRWEDGVSRIPVEVKLASPVARQGKAYGPTTRWIVGRRDNSVPGTQVLWSEIVAAARRFLPQNNAQAPLAITYLEQVIASGSHRRDVAYRDVEHLLSRDPFLATLRVAVDSLLPRVLGPACSGQVLLITDAGVNWNVRVYSPGIGPRLLCSVRVLGARTGSGAIEFESIARLRRYVTGSSAQVALSAWAETLDGLVNLRELPDGERRRIPADLLMGRVTQLAAALGRLAKA